MKFLTSLVVIYLDLEHPMTCICSGIPPPPQKKQTKKTSTHNQHQRCEQTLAYRIVKWFLIDHGFDQYLLFSNAF